MRLPLRSGSRRSAGGDGGGTRGGKGSSAERAGSGVEARPAHGVRQIPSCYAFSVGTRWLLPFGIVLLLSFGTSLEGCGDPSVEMSGWVHRTNDQAVAGAVVHTTCEPDSTWG